LGVTAITELNQAGREHGKALGLGKQQIQTNQGFGQEKLKR
jgi:hypothetical protein